MANTAPPVVVGVQAVGLAEIQRDIGRANRGLKKNLQKKLADAGKLVATDWKARASWSSRIPRTIHVSSSAKGVKVVGGGKNAPHAAAFEAAGTFRHPVFGQDVWVDQQGRPSALPALQAHLDQVAEVAAEALDLWAQDAGFK